MTTDELAERLIHARDTVPFVQANLIKVARRRPGAGRRVARELQRARRLGERPVPLYPYPELAGLPPALRRAGRPAWERAHAHYLGQFDHFSDIQDERPPPLPELEAACGSP